MAPVERPKKYRRTEVVERALRMAGKKRPYYGTPGWGENTGRMLRNYSRIHAFLVNNFPKQRIRGMKITHLGAGNGQYMDFLARKYGAKVTSVEPEPKYIEEALKNRMTKAHFKQARAEATRLRSNSQDIVISDHLLYAGYMPVHDEGAVKEAARILKPDGLLVLERSSLAAPPDAFEKAGLELVAVERKPGRAGAPSDVWGSIFVFRKTDDQQTFPLWI